MRKGLLMNKKMIMISFKTIPKSQEMKEQVFASAKFKGLNWFLF